MFISLSSSDSIFWMIHTQRLRFLSLT